MTEVLLLLREDVRIWTVPEGGSEPGETPEQTALRETLEETGAHVEVVDKLGTYFRPNMPNGENLAHAFITKFQEGNLADAGWEAAEVRWFETGALPKRLTAMSRELINDAINFSGKPVEKTQSLSGFEAFILRIAFSIRDVRNALLKRK